MKLEQPTLENLNMKPFTLDDPLTKILSEKTEGYRFCPNCGRYEHHPLKKCDDCGAEIIRVKHLSIRTFIMLTARHGSGPINTLHTTLWGNWKFCVDMSNQPEWKFELEQKADQLYYAFGGTSGWWDGAHRQGDKAISEEKLEEKRQRGIRALELYKEGKLR